MSIKLQGNLAYRINVPCFQDSDGDGIGDVGGVICRCDYLADLGVSVVILSPIFLCQSVCTEEVATVDYLSVDPRLGSAEALQRLAAELHKRGMTLILELEDRYTSDQNAWFLDERNNQPTLGDAYAWVGGGSEQAEWVAERNQAYLHAGQPTLPKINQGSPRLARRWIEIASYWSTHGVDGLLPHSGSGSANLLTGHRRMALPSHLGGEGTRIFVDETQGDRDLSDVFLATRVCGYVPRLQASKRRLFGLILLTLKATPEVRHGDELGYFDDEIIMPWDTDGEAAFTQGVPWRAMPTEGTRSNVKLQRADPESTLSMFTHLAHLRRYSPALRYGDYHALRATDPDIFAYVREDERQRFLIVTNLSGMRKRVNVSGSPGSWVAGTHMVLGDGLKPSTGQLALEPYEGRVYESLWP